MLEVVGPDCTGSLMTIATCTGAAWRVRGPNGLGSTHPEPSFCVFLFCHCDAFMTNFIAAELPNTRRIDDSITTLNKYLLPATILSNTKRRILGGPELVLSVGCTYRANGVRCRRKQISQVRTRRRLKRHLFCRKKYSAVHAHLYTGSRDVARPLAGGRPFLVVILVRLRSSRALVSHGAATAWRGRPLLRQPCSDARPARLSARSTPLDSHY
ncbi:hypothetical protein EVAR_8222_1 [Eumeta japonica]|uniref:Uncharacterized protein n=1 Tax=Eumeta variegata TaxID=151549 RepID=A0A4C1TFM9_EUMVA|nr:hypothetical protein EVAR_8222_1 [Eumeta japonica]